MDPRTMVNRERVKAGEQFCRKLLSDGFDLQGAMWAMTEDDVQPYLYLVTTNVDSDGPIGAYTKLDESLTAFQSGVNDPFTKLDFQEIKLLAPRMPLAGELLFLLKRYPDDQPTYQTSMNRGVPVLAAYVYPAALFAPPAAAQQPA